jgi:hypothetical protein
MLLVAAFDGILLSRKIKKLVAEKFPTEIVKGIGMYAWLRSTQMRRLRTPKPTHKVGDTNF